MDADDELKLSVKPLYFRSESDKEWTVGGTAFLVGARHLMTALHCVLPGYDKGQAAVRALALDEQGAECLEVVWPPEGSLGDGSPDLALLEMAEGQGDRRRCWALGRTWSELQPCYVVGYPGGTRLRAFLGRTGARQTDHLATVEGIDSRPEDSRGWHLVSGSPVIRNHGVVGIVIHRDEDFRQSLGVLPFAALSDGDWSAIQEILDPGRRHELEGLLRERLKGQEDVARGLAGAIGAETQADGVARWLVDRPLGEALALLERVHRDLIGKARGSTESRESRLAAADVIIQCMLLLWPWRGGQDTLRYHQHASGLISMDQLILTAAEVVRAKVRGDVARFAPPDGKKRLLVPRDRIPASPKKELDGIGRTRSCVDLVRSHLMEMLGYDEDDLDPRDLNSMLRELAPHNNPDNPGRVVSPIFTYTDREAQAHGLDGDGGGDTVARELSEVTVIHRKKGSADQEFHAHLGYVLRAWELQYGSPS
jgi:hypothetical protein